MRATILATALALTACAEPQVIRERIYVRQEIPPSLLECAAWPKPDPLPSDVRGLVTWLAEGRAAYVDCSYKLGQVRGLVTVLPTDDQKAK